MQRRYCEPAVSLAKAPSLSALMHLDFVKPNALSPTVNRVLISPKPM